MTTKKKRSRVRRQVTAPALSGNGLPQPRYLAEKQVPLARAVRLALNQLSELRDPEKFDARLNDIEEHAARRVKRMLAGKSERAALEALRVATEGDG